ncbi:hypothetical protein P4O66_002078 [Electrophorus voltai]|uniref:MAM domain containing glycosylphosphatidylinositol anchor 1 n=1 Tax=Electrophorus voltai TaxID=2609070 RepID=A0AAD9DTD2_9TELE|nr:hypothetical protein P4O66_002078 [Electrophorus voltai]
MNHGIASDVVPPVLSVPAGWAVVNATEGGTAELVCLAEGKPRPPVLWSRVNKDLPMPSGDWTVETRDGRLRLTNVTRDVMGAYRCQTAPYNGLNIKRRTAQVQLNVEYPPVVDPLFKEVRSANYKSVVLRCAIQKSNPNRVVSADWFLNGVPIQSPPVEPQESPQLRFVLDPNNNGTYDCQVSNGVGSSTCTFFVTARPYNVEFYFDTPNPIRILKGSNYSYNLQWTQKEPDAGDKIIGYWLNVQQRGMKVLSKQITTRDPVKGVLMSYTIMDLRVPLSYHVGLMPITTFGTGDNIIRTIHYSEQYVCGFEDPGICGFSQDQTDVFDWTRQNHLSQNPKRSVNTGPDTDNSGTKEGYYMYIETSRPRLRGDKARLLSPVYNATAVKGPSGFNRPPYCVSFFYHMNGKHIAHLCFAQAAFSLQTLALNRTLGTGTLNVLIRVKGIATVNSLVWTLSGHQGPVWTKASVVVYPGGPFQVREFHAAVTRFARAPTRREVCEETTSYPVPRPLLFCRVRVKTERPLPVKEDRERGSRNVFVSETPWHCCLHASWKLAPESYRTRVREISVRIKGYTPGDAALAELPTWFLAPLLSGLYSVQASFDASKGEEDDDERKSLTKEGCWQRSTFDIALMSSEAWGQLAAGGRQSA